MKKLILVVAVILMLVVASAGLFACGGVQPLQGTAWANQEIFTYRMEIDGVERGTLTTTLNRIRATQNTRINGFENYFNVNGALVQYVVYQDGYRALFMQSIITETVPFRVIASYTYKNTYLQYGKGVSAIGYVYGNRFNFNQIGGESNSVSANAVCNSMLYLLMRAYEEMNTGHSISAQVLDTLSGELETLSIVSNGSVELETAVDFAVTDWYLQTNSANIFTRTNQAQRNRNLVVTNAVRVRINKTTPPTGLGITVYYTLNTTANRLQGSFLTPNNVSVNVPIRIVEDNTVFTLTSAEVN